MNTTRCASVCWAGISRTTAWETLTNSGFPSSPSATETAPWPNHFHWYKTEDIINRGGGNVLIRVYNSLPNEEIDYESDVTIHTDGRTYQVPAGTQIRLTPGESIHVQQYLYHDFSVEEGTGAVLLGEVSQCNDDNTDNRFNPPVGRFPKIEEDEAPYRLLCNEYPAAKETAPQ